MAGKGAVKRSLLFFLILCAWGFSQTAMAARKAMATAVLTMPGRVHDQVAVAPGSNTEDPRAVLRAAQDAVSSVRTLTYDAVYRGEAGLSVGPAVRGRVALAKLGPGNPLLARLNAQGTFFAAGSDVGVQFHTSFDGTTIYKLLPDERTLLKRTLSEGDPAENHLSFVTSFFGGGPYELILFPLVVPGLVARLAERPVVEYGGKTIVNGALCHAIYTEDKAGKFHEWWYIGVKDHLPYELESVATDAQGRWGATALKLSDLRINGSLSESAFRIARPAGYAVKMLRHPVPPKPLAAGTPAPNWNLSEASGRRLTLSQYRGKVVVMDFWATWCAPCVRSLPDLEKLYEDYSGRGVVVLGINSWEESNPVAYMQMEHYRFPNLLNGETIAKAYQVVDIPAVYVIGTDGKIVYGGAPPSEEFLSGVVMRCLAKR